MWRVLLQPVRWNVGLDTATSLALTSHAFSTAPRGPQREEWQRIRLKQLKEHASRLQGECLSDQYENSRTKLLWRCNHRHTWRARADSVLNAGSWCPTCAGVAPIGLGRLKEHAARKDGECLAETCKNAQTKLPWKCQKGHKWMASAASILNGGTWCPHCAGKAPVGLRRLQEHANKLGGKCLATAYKRVKSKVLWQCQLGHTWEATPDSVLHRGTWCPFCARSKWRTESAVKQLFEDIFCPHKFPSSFPAFLAGLQLDGHCSALNLAFEYHGEQHFNPDNYFNSFGPDSFSKQRERDARKLRLCESFAVRLLVIPYFIRDKRNFVLLSLLRWFRISEVNRNALQSGAGVCQPFDVVSSSASGSGR
ncbi:unnamed protein product [Effrenium voratum]|nr:unnamed protein product [Effrenium voratum]CAJ1424812.1 unnamed protein product [Effrenium voratum]